MLTRWLVFLGYFGIVILSGCWEKDQVPPATSANVPGKVVAANEQADCDDFDSSAVTSSFHARLREIAATYTEYGRFDGQMRWGSLACSPYRVVTPDLPELHASASQDSRTHGRKLYSIFAKRLFMTGYTTAERGGLDWDLRPGHVRGRYFTEGKANPIGQVLVKESWVPEEIPDTGQRLQPGGQLIIQRHRRDDPPAEKNQLLEPAKRIVKVRERTVNVEDSSTDAAESGKLFEEVDSFVPYVRYNGRLYSAAMKGPLFIMFKMAPKTPDTDEGWVYGTTTADGKEVISAGRVESCMSCHQKAPHDRLFGLPPQ